MTMLLLTAGTNYVYHAPAERLLRWLPDASIDLIVTSPPYDNLRTYKGFTWDFEYIARQSYRVLKPGGVMVWVVGDSVVDGSETLNSFRQALYFKDVVGFNVHDTMIWNKDGNGFPDVSRYYQVFEFMFVLSKGTPKTRNLITQLSAWTDKRKSKIIGRNEQGELLRSKYAINKGVKVLDNVWRVGTGWGKTTKDTEAYEHPAMFPEKLAERHILTWSNPGDVVLDFFMGSGTTAKMARNNGRRYIGCDIAADYVALTNERLAKPYNLQLFAEATA